MYTFHKTSPGIVHFGVAPPDRPMVNVSITQDETAVQCGVNFISAFVL